MKKSVVILLHIAYWLLYLFLIFCFLLFIPNALRQGNAHFVRVFVAPPIVLNFIVAPLLCFYIFYAVIFPKFLSTKKFFLLFVSGSLTALFCAALCLVITSSMYPLPNSLEEELAMVGFISLLACIHGVIGLVMKGFISWYADIKWKEELNRKNFEMELALVKSQINPHFLFNTINNIDVLILKDGEKASAFLNKLSGIMRFMLYETKTEKIPLQKELDYIQNYVELQQIRTSNPNYIDYKLAGDVKHIQIAPMLFIPFIENAFKYADDNKSAHAVKICVVINKDQLEFICENSYAKSSRVDHLIPI